VTEAGVDDQLAQDCCLKAERPGVELAPFSCESNALTTLHHLLPTVRVVKIPANTPPRHSIVIIILTPVLNSHAGNQKLRCAIKKNKNQAGMNLLLLLLLIIIIIITII